MAITLKRFQELESKVSRLQRDLDRAEGALDEQMKRLKKEHGCDSIKMAEKKLKDMDGKVEKAEQKFTEALLEFDEEWALKLEDG